MSLTPSFIRSHAIARDKDFILQDMEGLYLQVKPDGTLSWHVQFTIKGWQKEIKLGDYPELSLYEARKIRGAVLRLAAENIEPTIPKEMDIAPSEEIHPLIAYYIKNNKMPLATGNSNRDWMDQTPSRYAYRCLPMLIANQSGWMLQSNHKILAVWDGRPEVDALKITCMKGDPALCNAISIFGSGILTFTLPYLFRTPPGFNLMVQGPMNQPKDGVTALCGVVETDWAEATFTMNWMITRPHHPIVFEIGEPVCMLIPQRRFETETFQPIIRNLDTNPELHHAYWKWSDSRAKFNEDLKIPESQAVKDGWQKHYTQGKTFTEKRSTSHQSKLSLRNVIDET